MANHGHLCNQECDHSLDDERGIHYTLYTKIDLNNVVCLNEAEEGSGKNVFRPWNERLLRDKVVESYADEELLFNIPFTGNVKLKGVIVIGGEEDAHPSRMRLFKNRPNMTFDDVLVTADQEFEMHRDDNGNMEYATRIVTFSSVSSLSIHFSNNSGSEISKVYFIGLRGEFTEAPRQGVAICSYELSPNPAEHRIKGVASGPGLIH